jgi:hypothetical protein
MATTPTNPYAASSFKSSQPQYVTQQQAWDTELARQRALEGQGKGYTARGYDIMPETGLALNPQYTADIGRQQQDAFMRDYSKLFQGLPEASSRALAGVYANNYGPMNEAGLLNPFRNAGPGGMPSNTNVPSTSVPASGSMHSLAPEVPGGEEELRRKLSMMFTT